MRITAASLSDGRTFLGTGLASQDGWLALGTSAHAGGADTTGGGNWAWALIEVADPDRSPFLVPADHGGAWSGGHRSATAVGGINNIRVVTPSPGRRRRSRLPASRVAGRRSVDRRRSGVLVNRPTGPRYAIKPIDGGPVVPDVPRLAPYGGSRYWAAGGLSLDLQ